MKMFGPCLGLIPTQETKKPVKRILQVEAIFRHADAPNCPDCRMMMEEYVWTDGMREWRCPRRNDPKFAHGNYRMYIRRYEGIV